MYAVGCPATGVITADAVRIQEVGIINNEDPAPLYTQTGMLTFHIADLRRDEDLFPSVETAAEKMLVDTPETVGALIERWLGDAVNYADV